MEACTVTPFKAKSEDGAEWELLYNLFADRQVGDVVTYDEIDAALGRDFRAYRSPIYKTRIRLLKQKSLGIVSLSNIGYRVVQAKEHEGQARKHHRRSKKQMDQAVTWIQHTDRTGMTLDERNRLERIEHQLIDQTASIKRLDGKVRRQEEITGLLSEKQNASDGRVTKLIDILRRKNVVTEDELAQEA